MNDRGKQAESLAAEYLRRQGLKLVERNYRCRHGEIDLIMQEGDALVFVEVRLRRHGSFGGASASLDAHKQRRIVLAAQQYLAGLGRIPPCRFDALLLTDLGDDHVEWLRNAFSA